jgi:prepilin-type N-terminal cleavage/methylation domain-containing protein
MTHKSDSRGSITRSAGFSLVEIIVVVIIVGLVVLIMLPKFDIALRGEASDRASRVVATDMELALADAARSRKPVRVTYSSDSLSYTITDRAAGTVYITRKLGTGSAFSLSSVSFSPATFDALPNGVLTAAVTVTLTSASKSHTVTVSKAGQVRVS